MRVALTIGLMAWAFRAGLDAGRVEAGLVYDRILSERFG